MLKDDPSEFLRRCSVICLEDAVLHPALPMLTWLTAAQVAGVGAVGECIKAGSSCRSIHQGMLTWLMAIQVVAGVGARLQVHTSAAQ